MLHLNDWHPLTAGLGLSGRFVNHSRYRSCVKLSPAREIQVDHELGPKVDDVKWIEKIGESVMFCTVSEAA